MSRFKILKIFNPTNKKYKAKQQRASYFKSTVKWAPACPVKSATLSSHYTT